MVFKSQIHVDDGSSSTLSLTNLHGKTGSFAPIGRKIVRTYRKEDIRLHGERNSKLPWREAGPPNHLNDEVDSVQ